MPRHTGCRNQSDYKYVVQTLINDVWVKKMYISQKDISDDTGLKRTAVYYLSTDPAKVKGHRNIKIMKLDEPLPVFTHEVEEEGDCKIIKIRKNLYIE